MADRLITRTTLNEWIINDGLEHLFCDGYLTPEQVDPEDAELRKAVQDAYDDWKDYARSAEKIQKLVDKACA